jgi:outer membrane protein OmpA-like peptidoglycan-associated protein
MSATAASSAMGSAMSGTITTTDTILTRWELRDRSRVLPIAVGLLGLGTLWGGNAILRHGSVQDSLRDRAAAVLVDNGYKDISIGMSGRDATITGTVASEADIAKVHDLVRDRTGMRHVTDRLTVAAAAPATAAPAATATTVAAAAPITAAPATAAPATAAPATAAPATTVAPAPEQTAPPATTGVVVDVRPELALNTVYFALGSAVLDAAANPKIAAVATIMKANPALRVQIEGHTDSQGAVALNEALSTQRTANVRAALIAAGIDASRLDSTALGSTKPADDNAAEAGRAKNRRVSFSPIG